MVTPLRALLVEDSEDDAYLLTQHLTRAGYDVTSQRVETVEAFRDALRAPWDIVFADYHLPTCTALDLLDAHRAVGADVPFIVVSGAMGEELGVTAMLHGAHDYIFKGNLSRLVPATERELSEAAVRRARAVAQGALHDQTRILRSILDSMVDGVVVRDATGAVLLHNRASEAITGVVPVDGAAESWVTSYGAYLPDGKTPFPTDQFPMVRALRGEESRNVEILLRSPVRPDGVWISVSGTALRDELGASKGAVMVIRDVSERRRAEETLRRTEEQFLQSQKMEAMGRLAGGVAHDFNNVLSIIGNYATLLMHDLSATDPMRGSLEEIHKAAMRASKLTRQLLTFARRHPAQARPVDLNAVILEMERMLHRLIREDIILVTTLQPDIGRVRADPAQIEQVLLNLVVNARDAMPDGGRIIIETSQVDVAPGLPPGPYVQITVTDTGRGMDPEVLSHVFEPFFTTKSEGHGTGLGLATVYGIVTASGGDITALSEPGQGTTFRMRLPRATEGTLVDAPSQTRALPVQGGTETVLLVEDDEPLCDLVGNILRRYRYRVLAARNAGEALLLAERHSGAIHLMLTDVVMPHMSGRELMERLGPLRPEMRVLYMSGYAGGGVGVRDRVPEGAPLVSKPFTVEGLARMVRDVLDAPGTRATADGYRRATWMGGRTV